MKTIILTLLAALAGFSLTLAAGIGLDFLYAHIYKTEPNGLGFGAGAYIGLFAGVAAGVYVHDEL